MHHFLGHPVCLLLALLNVDGRLACDKERNMYMAGTLETFWFYLVVFGTFG